MLRRIGLALTLLLVPASALAAACGPTYGADGLTVAADGGVWLTHYEDARLALRAADGGWSQWGSLVSGQPVGLSGLRLDAERKLAWAVAADGDGVIRLDLRDGTARATSVDGIVLGHRGQLAGDGSGGLWILAAVPADDGLRAPSLWRLGVDGAVMERHMLPVDAITSATMAAAPGGRPMVVLHHPGVADAELVEDGRSRPLPGIGATVTGMAVAGDGTLWLAAPDRNALAEWKDGRLRLHPLPTPAALPVTVEIAGDGGVWVTEWDGRKLARYTRANGWREYPVPKGEDAPIAMAFATDGGVWFSTLLAYDLFHLNPISGTVSRHAVPPPEAEAAQAPFATCHLGGPAAQTRLVSRHASRHARGYPAPPAQSFELNCNTACHTWLRVEQAAQRRREWSATVDRMVEANGAPLSPATRDQIIDYLNQNYTRGRP